MSRSSQGAQGLGKSFTMGIVGGRRGCTADDVDQLPHLVLAHADNVTIDFIGGSAASHQFHQRTPAFDDGGGDTGAVGSGA